MRRWLVLFALLPNCTGCLYYAYPTISHTPEVAVENKDGAAHAFRVDIDKTEKKPAPTVSEYTLTRIPIDSRGLVPSQLEVAPASGVYNPFGLIDGAAHEKTQYTMTVRLYKPGCRTMEVQAWDKSKAWQWIAAPTLADQERAIDDLLADPETRESQIRTASLPVAVPTTWWELKDLKGPSLGLQPGGIAPSQRQALHFAASEYARLANSPAASGPNMQIAKERLQQKAIWLKKYADGQ